jgi:signal transduction histidine kinase
MPLVLSVSLDRATLLAGWRGRAITTALVFVLLAALATTSAVLWNEQRRVRKELRQRAMITQKLEALGQMTGGITHDFRNLITAADAGLALALTHVEDSVKVRRYISMAREALQRGTSLTLQLLTFAKRQELEIEKADVNELVRSLEPLLRQAAGSGVNVTFDYTAALPACHLDHAQFDAALLNLVVNARDAMAEGGEIQIRTSLREELKSRKEGLEPGNYVCVEVKDSGPGMPPEVLVRAFDPFFTTKGEQGTGLGLSQVYGFLRQIGGEARIKSVVGVGTTVGLYFPVAPPARTQFDIPTCSSDDSN